MDECNLLEMFSSTINSSSSRRRTSRFPLMHMSSLNLQCTLSDYMKNGADHCLLSRHKIAVEGHDDHAPHIVVKMDRQCTTFFSLHKVHLEERTLFLYSHLTRVPSVIFCLDPFHLVPNRRYHHSSVISKSRANKEDLVRILKDVLSPCRISDINSSMKLNGPLKKTSCGCLVTCTNGFPMCPLALACDNNFYSLK